MLTNTVGWFEIYVQDMDRAKKFYESVLQIQFSDMPTVDDSMLMSAFPCEMNTYGAGGALVQMQGFSSGGNSVLVYFSCDDCAVQASRVVAYGGQVIKEISSIGEHGYFALAIDTEGNTFGLYSTQ